MVLGNTLLKNNPKGTLQNAWGEFLKNIPKSLNQVNNILNSVKEIKKQDTPNNNPVVYDINAPLPNANNPNFEKIGRAHV